MHDSARAWFEDRAAALPKQRYIVEIGGRDINGGVRDLFPADRFWSLDLHPGPGVDEVADACEWQPDAPVDLCLCAEVMEHEPRGALMLRRIHEWLAPGGILLLATVGDPWPEHSGYDGGALRYGEFYRGVSGQDLTEWSDPFDSRYIDCLPNGDRFLLAVKADPARPERDAEALWNDVVAYA